MKDLLAICFTGMFFTMTTAWALYVYPTHLVLLYCSVTLLDAQRVYPRFMSLLAEQAALSPLTSPKNPTPKNSSLVQDLCLSPSGPQRHLLTRSPRVGGPAQEIASVV